MELKSEESAPVILVVDDELSIRKSLEGVLKDEGYTAVVAEDSNTALALLESLRPALILLDIWMPGLDGLETLRKIKELHAEVPVIMMSGHATIATAVEATRMGASDFIEKPLELKSTLDSINRILKNVANPSREDASAGSKSGSSQKEESELKLGKSAESLSINPLVFSFQAMRGKAIPQKTLAQSALLYGQGLHSGRKSGLTLEPLPPNSGIHFVGVSEKTVVPAHVDFVKSTGFATSLELGRTKVSTIEHLLSALCAYGVSNLLVKCNGEVPVLDGSALEFCNLFEEIGLVEQPGDWFELEIKKKIEFGEGKEWIRIEPAEFFAVDYTLEYPEPVGRQQMLFTLSDSSAYKAQIASARTFGFVKDIGALQRQGLALGGRFDNFVLIGPEGPINDELRFSDEPVRHKILDAIGDLYLLGRRLKGKVTAHMTGHSDNINLLKKIRAELAEQK